TAPVIQPSNRITAPVTHESIKKSRQRNNLKILIPAVAVVIAVAVIFGSGMMHQPLPPPPTTPPPSPHTVHLPSLTTSPTHGTVPNNTFPTAADQSVTTNQNTAVSITLAGTDSNQNATLTAHITSSPLHGTLSSVNQDTGAVTYTPNQGFTGNDSFTFKVND